MANPELSGNSQDGSTTFASGLANAGVPVGVAARLAHLPPTSALFAAFLGYNPIGTLLSPTVLQALPAANRTVLVGHEFFPNLISYPMSIGLHSVFYLSVVMCLVAACASVLRDKARIATRKPRIEEQDDARPRASVTVSNE